MSNVEIILLFKIFLMLVIIFAILALLYIIGILLCITIESIKDWIEDLFL